MQKAPLFKIGDKVRPRHTSGSADFIVHVIDFRKGCTEWHYAPESGPAYRESALMASRVASVPFPAAFLMMKEGKLVTRLSWKGARAFKLVKSGLVEVSKSGKEKALDRFSTSHLLAQDWIQA